MPGLGVDAVVWEETEHPTGEETTLSGAYLTFMIVATIIAGIGVLLDQPILIVGAMVVGPEFGPLAALCMGAVRGHLRLALQGTVALVVGFAVAMAVTVVTTWGLAGIAGMLSLTSAKAGTLVGVLISVTTVPAAANAAVALAYGVADEAAGSALQLVINVAAIVAPGC